MFRFPASSLYTVRIVLLFAALVLFLLSCAAGEGSGQSSPRIKRSTVKLSDSCPLETSGDLFTPFPPGELFSLFGRNRKAMHHYLYNGDDLWPKSVNLCTRGRNALLDLELGPGTAFDLALFGPAWEVHLHSVAATNEFLPNKRNSEEGQRNGRNKTKTALKGTRYIDSWPLVTAGLLEYLLQAHRFQVLSEQLIKDQGKNRGNKAKGTDGELAEKSHGKDNEAESKGIAKRGQSTKSSVEELKKLARKNGFLRYLNFLRHTCSLFKNSNSDCSSGYFKNDANAGKYFSVDKLEHGLLELSGSWGRRLKGSVLHRLEFSARYLNVQTGSIEVTSSKREIEAFVNRLRKAAEEKGVFFNDRRYNDFRRRYLTVKLPDYPGRLSSFQLLAIEKQLLGRSSLNKDKLERVQRARAELAFIMEGTMNDSLLKKARQDSLKEVREEYTALKREVEADRNRLKTLAKRWFEERGKARLAAHLTKAGVLLLGGCYYFETEHLLEARSGFTHVSVIQQMDEPEGGPWQFDRVLGFQYAYPVAKLANSVVVELVEPAPEVVKRKRSYIWVSMKVPEVFRFPNGAVSDEVTLTNIVYHMKRVLDKCPRLRVTPGFFYAAATWLVRKKENSLLFKTAWKMARHGKYTYLNLRKDRLQELKGKTILIPVEYRPLTAGI